MKSFILSSFEELTLKELSEFKIKGKKVGSEVVGCDVDEAGLALLNSRGQSFRKVLVELGTVLDLKKIDFSIGWADYFWSGCSFKVEVEGVPGNEERFKIGREIGSKIFVAVNEELGFDLQVDLKNPDVTVLVYFDGKKYFIGLDSSGYLLDKRSYRVFVNPASLRGDLGYYLVRKSSFVSGEKLVVGLVKDGTVLIEAALFGAGLEVNSEEFAFEKWPLFKSFKNPAIQKNPQPPKSLVGFDNSMMSIRAARKNAQIAGVAKLVELNKFDVDEIDVKFSEGSVDRLIFQVTRKDEAKLNELYYQANYVLKKKGTFLMVSRGTWEPSISGKFKLLSEEVVKRGGSSHKVWLLEKK
ncbi:hypothetical protein GOV03_03890 [Candidatus Woesearchaeota archaeon]|nr:hypothetical protein [Candidatus Woesearchaeota archaeon]